MIAALAVYLSAVVLYVLFLAYCTLKRMYDEKRIPTMPRIVRGHLYAILGVAVAVDVLFNWTVGTVVFLELPELRRSTLTMRCKKWKDFGLAPDSPLLYRWRGAVARWACEGWMNPAEPGHC